MKSIIHIIKVMLYSLKHPKQTIAAIYRNSIEQSAEERRKKRILLEVSLSDLIGDDFPLVYPHSFSSWGSSILDIVLLNGLAKRNSQCSYLEIGTWQGESICNVSRYAKECVSISLSEDQVRKRYGERYAQVINYYCKKQDRENITLIGADSKTFDFSSLNKKFDLIFIDGDHSYEGIINDTKKALSCVRDSNSIIVWHDYTFGPEKIRYSVLDPILTALPEELHQDLYHVENTMCAILYRNAIQSKVPEEFPKLPENDYEITIATK